MNRRTRRVVLPLLCCAAVMAAAQLVPARRPPADETGAPVSEASYPEWLRPCNVPRVRSRALCGMYDVWENRERTSGRRIGLNVLVLPARSPERRQPDPVFYLAGGPGAGASMQAPLVENVLELAHRDRDLVFVDVRGTGNSQPLSCPLPDRRAPAQKYFGMRFDTAYVRGCRARLLAHVEHYHTTNAVDDLDEVRGALGYARINLFGISGGTRTAQLYLKRHTRSVRSAVLKGVVPMDFEMPVPFAQALDRGMRAVIDACAAEPACRAAYPDLAADWTRAQRRFGRGPVSAQVQHPYTGRKERVRFERGVFADGLRQLLYSIEQSRRVPELIHAAARGDFSALAQLELTRTVEFHALIAHGMYLSSTCTEDVPFITEEDVQRATAGTFLADDRVRRQRTACAIWAPEAKPDTTLQQPVRVTLPVLLISGELDTATPPDAAERVARMLPNSRHIVFPNQSHDFANMPCESRLISEFVAAPNPTALDVRCVPTTRRPPFIVRRTR